MQFIVREKTDWKYLLIVAILAGIVGGGILYWRQNYFFLQFALPLEEGICKNQCGDGTCQEIVCLAEGCPCAETKESCPQDCEIKDETADWQTYRNKEYGFEVKYPFKEWEILEYFEEQYPEIMIISKVWRTDMPEGGMGFVISIRDISLDDFISDYEHTNKPYCSQPVSERNEFTLSGFEAVKLTVCTAEGVGHNFIFARKNNKSYIIKYQDYDSVHNQILSTFRFLE